MTVDVKAARELCEAATPGPWVTANGKGSAVVRTEHPEHDCAIYLNVRTCEVDECVERWQADAAFIAASRTLVPALLDALDDRNRHYNDLLDTHVALINEANAERDTLKRLLAEVCDIGKAYRHRIYLNSEVKEIGEDKIDRISAIAKEAGL